MDADYSWKSLVLGDVAPSIQRSRKTSYDFIQHAASADLTLSMGIGGRFEVGALVPVTVFQTGEDVSGSSAPGRGTVGLGNPKLGGKVRLAGGDGGLGAGAVVLVALPWGLGGPLIHEDQPRLDLRLFGELERQGWSVRAGAGYRVRRPTQLFDLSIEDELTFAAGADLRLRDTQIFAELAGVTAAGHPFASTRHTPVELLIGGRREIGAGWLGGDHRFWLLAAAGPGLTMGYGAPVARAVVALSWSNRSLPKPPAPAPPPPPPPAPPPPAPKPPGDRDKDGITDDKDQCPDEPEDKDGFEDEDGCPDPDNDKDGILDAADKCPAEPETINGVQDDDGCPDKGEAAVHIGKAELETLKPIFFETDHARVRHAFYNILGQVALTLKAHPEIGRCAVEGHTDDTGPSDWNQRLSVLRAEAVVEFLVDKGVERARLTAIGHGEKLPWASNETEIGRAQNRRVLFHIEGVGGDAQKKEQERARPRLRKRAPADPAAKEPGASGGESIDEPQDEPKSAKSRSKSDTKSDGNSGRKLGGKGAAERSPKSEIKPDSKSDGKPANKSGTKSSNNPDHPATLRDLLRLPER